MSDFEYDVFLSYSRNDAIWAEKLRRELEGRGIKVFYDQQRLTAGDNWARELAITIQRSRNLLVLWSAGASVSSWVSLEIAKFDLIRFPAGQSFATPGRRMIKVALDATPSTHQELQRIDALAAPIMAGATADTVGGPLWNDVVGQVQAAIHRDNPAIPVRLAVFAMTRTELAGVHPDEDPDIGRSFADVVHALGFGLGNEAEPKLADRYGEGRRDWRPFGGEQTVGEILDGVLGEVNQQVGQPEYRWEPVDLMAGSREEARLRVADFCAGPAAIVVDPLSLYRQTIRRRYELLSECAKNANALVSVFTSFAPPAPMVTLREITRELAGPLINPYYAPPIPQQPHPLLAVNVGDRVDVSRLVRSCLGQFAGETQTRSATTPFLRAS